MGNLAIYATKGFEYLLILSFLALFTAFYLYFTSSKFESVRDKISQGIDGMVDWFKVPAGLLFHQGHTWVKVDESDNKTVRIGIDDFAQRMAGKVGLKNVGNPGSKIQQGGTCWSLWDGEKSVDMLAPVSGEIVEINPAYSVNNKNITVRSNVLNDDPFGDGWILKVKPDDMNRERKNLLSGVVARKWMEDTIEKLRVSMNPELGAVYQDGGVPMPGMAKIIADKEWDNLLREFFLT